MRVFRRQSRGITGGSLAVSSFTIFLSLTVMALPGRATASPVLYQYSGACVDREGQGCQGNRVSLGVTSGEKSESLLILLIRKEGRGNGARACDG
jgi:hypothetical protein